MVRSQFDPLVDLQVSGDFQPPHGQVVPARVLNDLPQIVLWRLPPLPSPDDKPDLVTQPMPDACILAHEFGHFCSDPTDRLHPLYDRARKGGPLTIEEKRQIMTEEETAWDRGRSALATLGCDEWGEFERRREQCLKTYRKGLAALPES